MKKFFWYFIAIICTILSYVRNDVSYMTISFVAFATIDILDHIEEKNK